MIHTISFSDVDGPVDAEVTLSILTTLSGEVLNRRLAGEVVRITVEVIP